HPTHTAASLPVASSTDPNATNLADGSEYDGRYGKTVEELIAFHRPRMEVLLEAEPDLLAIETIPSGIETEAIVKLLDHLPEARAWMTFSCRDAERLHDGTPLVEAAADAVRGPPTVAGGSDCTP